MPNGIPALEDECFFIAPIGKEGSSERNRSDGILEFIVGRAAQELGLTTIRGDQIGEPGQITLQVIAHILGAKAAVADLTGLNPNVFYELAVRHTAKLPVILIAERECKLPFDIAQMRTIFFDYTDLRSADQCRRDIVAQLREALDSGIVDSPIATSIDVRALQGGSAVERNIAELVTTIEQIASTQRDGNSTLQHINYLLQDSELSIIREGVLELLKSSKPRIPSSIQAELNSVRDLISKMADDQALDDSDLENLVVAGSSASFRNWVQHQREKNHSGFSDTPPF